MKNIHVLPKNIFNQLGVDHYGKTPTQIKIAEFLINKNIYITSDEEIKEGDWCYDKVLNLIFQTDNHTDFKYANQTDNVLKIILTTDQDLIKDGVQAIDDEFLEWFVKNPSCEWVEVVKEMYMPQLNGKISDGKITHELSLNPSDNTLPFYKIIIPQEEPKQEIDMSKYISGIDPYDTQATLEEVAKSEAFEFSVDYKPWETDLDYREYAEYGFEKGFIEGTKHQAERMYSEEIELINWLQQSLTAKKFYSTDAEDLIEQFKRK
jgi:hypothetical protein